MGAPTRVSSGLGAARRAGTQASCGVTGEAAASEPALGAGGGGLEPGSIGMRQALSEVLECAALGGRARGLGVVFAHGLGGQIYDSPAEEAVGRGWEGWGGLTWSSTAGRGLLLPGRDPGVLAQSPDQWRLGWGDAVCCSALL